MKKSSLIELSEKAFTLIELLTVIAIIAVLMGLLFPAISSVKEAARKTQARTDEAQIVAAVKSYNMDYGAYPLTPVQASAGVVGWDTVYGDPHGLYPNDQLFDVLRNNTAGVNAALVTSLNPRQVVYFDGPIARDAIHPKSGIATASATTPNGDTIKAGAYVDPWGNQYVVFLDANYDGTITSNGPNTPSGGGPYWFYYSDPTCKQLMFSAGACSLGRDGAWGTKQGNGNGNGMLTGSDDTATWQ